MNIRAVLILLCVVVAAGCVAGAPVPQGGGGNKLASGATSLHHGNSNSGDQKEGVLQDSSSLAGSTITDAVGNTVTKTDQNTDVHDNTLVNPSLNMAEGTTGSTVVGNSNKIARRDGNKTAVSSETNTVAGNTLTDPKINGIDNNRGPSMAGDNGVFVPTTNESGAIQFGDSKFMDAAAAS
ncbi:hypothetical protein H4R18_000776 [Coemansia javaensis]|uniref:Uncharacterized protein n=1 Tax=Coemansia javaensis TaxID=2761396 RepID=A0A9W8HNE6_9FUNG|nr:hypothetical protein H4R18_000776 [Coemansia javaensis]